jgi:hypothetical protein
VLKAILVSRDYITHLKGIFPKMCDYLTDYGTFAWFTTTYSVDEFGNSLGNKAPMDDDEDEDAAEKAPHGEEPVASSYSCLKPLTQLCVPRMNVLGTKSSTF